MTSGTLTVPLSCGCRQTVRAPRPDPGTEFFCRKHNDYATVLDDSAERIRIKCLDCPLGRSFGTDESAANRSASRHVIKQSHRVAIYKGSKELEIIAPQGRSLPYDSLLNRRRTLATGMQRQLRDSVTKSLPANDGGTGRVMDGRNEGQTKGQKDVR
jgi:hypothetical protein